MEPTAAADTYRVLAHPLRSRILAHLRLHGGSTSAELARALSTHTGATSYHVRVLESAGLVEDTGLGSAKTRVWAIADDESDDDDGPTTDALGFIDEADAEDARWLEHDYVTHVSERAHAWVDEQEGWTYVWQEECRAFDAPVLVSEEQMSALRSEMEALLGRYRRMGAGTPGARRVAVTVIPLPLPPS
ncbi:helix-turn-helix domain-containing protein [Dermacoccus sp. Tok2021]|uniref:winged helix-turn-helix domain-containing protein n=1 Tax=Dermacoccus sp. Tok2021 TaxID=2826873 RepID=UPI001CA6A3DB|nr:helix-turn-helix domain-containing protein [Dermacoccus sp. Tok2021]MBZ4496840.1 helix-turn-helix domain-containing protein [Dermacoccus sp. Tok2021]